MNRGRVTADRDHLSRTGPDSPKPGHPVARDVSKRKMHVFRSQCFCTASKRRGRSDSVGLRTA